MTHSLRAAAIASALLLLLHGCGKAPEPGKPQVPGMQIDGEAISFPDDSPQLTTLRTTEAVPERASFVRINGRTVWDESRTSRVISSVAGRIVELKASPGSTVRRGDVLAIVSSPDYGQAQSEARRADTDLELATRSLTRARDLHDAGVLPLKDLQAAQADHARAKSERDRTAARERLYGGGSQIDQQFRIVAPISGVVVDRRINLGQEVRPDQGPDAAPLFVISDPAHLWIGLDIPEALSQEVQLGEAVRISVPALPGEVFTAQVDFIADFIDPQTRTVKARASVVNQERRLKAEMFVTADVEIPPSTALKVPATAAFLIDSSYYAFVEESPGRFVRRRIRSEEASLGFMRVTAGLNAGDKVVIDGALLLQRLLTQKASAPDATARDKAGRPK